MNQTDMVTTDAAREAFYPTPPALADKLMQGIDWDLVSSVLEPSAGNGNLVRSAAKAHDSRQNKPLDIDCVELDPTLRAVLSFEFGGKKEVELRGQLGMLRKKCEYDSVLRCVPELSAADKMKRRTLELAHQKTCPACARTLVNLYRRDDVWKCKKCWDESKSSNPPQKI